MIETNSAGHPGADQRLKPKSADCTADFLRKTGVESLEVIVQENGRPEDGFVFEQSRNDERQSVLAPASCIVKLFTAAIIAKLIKNNQIDPSQTLPEAMADVCRVDFDLPPGIANIKISDLLSHTHGLSSSVLQIAPCDEDGFISLTGVFGHIEREGSLFPPGKFHSYANIGYHILGILIEALHRKKYHQVLRDEILSVLQMKSKYRPDDLYAVDEQQVCPASGSGLDISGRLLYVFARALIVENGAPLGLCEESVNSFMAFTVKAPGWAPYLKGAGFGWKHYRNGWSGHSGSTEKSSVILRVNREGNHIVAFVGNSAGNNNGLSSTLAFLVKTKFPELFQAAAPVIKPHASITSSEVEALVGSFGDLSFRYVVVRMHNSLILKIQKAGLNGCLETMHSCPLIRGEEGGLFLQKPWKMTFFVQVIYDGQSSSRYIWDNESVWPEFTK